MMIAITLKVMMMVPSVKKRACEEPVDCRMFPRLLIDIFQIFKNSFNTAKPAKK